jgi:hypothetical protein
LVRAKGMSFDFPELIDPSWLEKYRELSYTKHQPTLMNFI